MFLIFLLLILLHQQKLSIPVPNLSHICQSNEIQQPLYVLVAIVCMRFFQFIYLLSVDLSHFQILRAIGKGSFGKVSAIA